MPDCYYLVSSTPEETAQDIQDCVADSGGPGQVEAMRIDGAEVEVWVHYESLGEAMRHLQPIKECLESKGHSVRRRKIVHHFREVGLRGDPTDDAAK